LFKNESFYDDRLDKSKIISAFMIMVQGGCFLWGSTLEAQILVEMLAQIQEHKVNFRVSMVALDKEPNHMGMLHRVGKGQMLTLAYLRIIRAKAHTMGQACTRGQQCRIR
jgi:hypothetical protein